MSLPLDRDEDEDDEEGDGSSIMGRAANIANTAKDLFGALWYGADEVGPGQGGTKQGSGSLKRSVSGEQLLSAGRMERGQRVVGGAGGASGLSNGNRQSGWFGVTGAPGRGP